MVIKPIFDESVGCCGNASRLSGVSNLRMFRYLPRVNSRRAANDPERTRWSGNWIQLRGQQDLQRKFYHSLAAISGNQQSDQSVQLGDGADVSRVSDCEWGTQNISGQRISPHRNVDGVSSLHTKRKSNLVHVMQTIPKNDRPTVEDMFGSCTRYLRIISSSVF